MVVLGSADVNVRRRWTGALAGRPDVVEAPSLAMFSTCLRRAGSGPALLHLALPRLRGLDGVWLLRRAFPHVYLMVFSDHPVEHEGRQVLAAGAAGYCNTYMAAPVLERAVEVVAMGEVWVSRTVVDALVRSVAAPDGRVGAGSRQAPINGQSVHASLVESLTEREQAVALGVADGRSNKEIASALGITERTVKSHLGAVFRKTGVRDRLHLAISLRDKREGGS